MKLLILLIVYILLSINVNAHVPIQIHQSELQSAKNVLTNNESYMKQYNKVEYSPSVAVPSPPSTFSVIGPFSSGMREIGGDVIATFGGIRNIPIGDSATYPSELADGGRVGWTQFAADGQGNINIAFPNIRWDYLNEPFGWAVTMFQAWAVGTFQVINDGSFLIQCQGVNDFYIDNQHIHGDVYAIGYGWFSVSLTKGTHTMYIHVSGMEEASFNCQFRAITEMIYVLPDDTIPNIVAGTLAGNYISLAILNASPQPISNIQVTEVMHNTNVKFQVLSNPVILPGQAYPLIIQTQFGSVPKQCPVTVTVSITATGVSSPTYHNVTFACVNSNSIFMFTYLDFDNTVQYAMAYPPAVTSCQGGCPVLLTTHGAGSKAEWLIQYYQQQKTAWVLAPNGRRRFGYDWEGPQLLNAIDSLQALASLPGQIITTRTPNTNRILFAGHSMGGHGCYMISTHFADRALGAAPASGWIKYTQYIPYYIRNGNSFIDSILQGLLISSITEYSPDLYLENLVGVPLLARIGGADEEVSPWHPRRIVRLMDQLSGNSSKAIMSEIPGQPHWWPGVVDDAQMQAFFDRHIVNASATYPPLPTNFTLICNNPARFGGRGGMTILQLNIPYRIGKIQVQQQQTSNGLQWNLKTRNIRRFGFYSLSGLAAPSSLTIDGQSFSTLAKVPNAHFCNLESKSWSLCQGSAWQNTERSPATYGPARQILEGPLMVIYGTQGSTADTQAMIQEAQYLANHLYMQARHAVLISSDADLQENQVASNNLILLGDPTKNLWSAKLQAQFPVKFSGASTFTIGTHTFNGTPDHPLGLMFLFPTGNQRLGLLVAGTDSSQIGFNIASKLIPTQSGLPIPDYIVANNDIYWKGEGSYEAAGYWDNNWQYRHEIGYIN